MPTLTTAPTQAPRQRAESAHRRCGVTPADGIFSPADLEAALAAPPELDQIEVVEALYARLDRLDAILGQIGHLADDREGAIMPVWVGMAMEEANVMRVLARRAEHLIA